MVGVFAADGLDLELVLVNDGSRDDSWAVVRDKVRTIPGAVAVNLLKNYGQHHANLAGLRETTGDYVITMDDDGQNPATRSRCSSTRRSRAATTSCSVASSRSRRPGTAASAAS